MRMLQRAATLVAALALGLVVAGCGGDSGSGSTSTSTGELSLSFASFPGGLSGLPAYIAVEKGFFKEQGLNATLVPISSPTAMIPGLQSGSLDIIPVGVSQAITLRQRDSKIKVIAGLNRTASYTVVGRPGVDVPSVAEGSWQKTILALAGKSIGTPNGDASELAKLMRHMMTLAGGDPATLSFVSVAPGGPTLAALNAGQVEVATPDLGTVDPAVAAGNKPLLDFGTEGPPEIADIAFSAFVTNESYLAAHPGVDDRFLTAMTKTYAFMQDPTNVAEVHRIAVDVSKVPDSPTLNSAIARQAQIYRAEYDEKTVQATMDLYVRAGMVAPEPIVRPSDLYTTTAMKG